MDRLVKTCAALAVVAALAGCEESADTSRRIGALEAKVASLEDGRSEVAAEAAKLRELSAALSRTVGKLEGALAGAESREAELSDRLAAAAKANETLKAEMDLLRKAVAAVAPTGPVPQYPVKPVLKMLGHSDAAIRDSASRILRRLADPESIGPLVAIIESRADPATQRSAAHALGAFKDERAHKALIALIDSPDSNTRRTVYQSMGDIGDPALVGPLLKALAAEKERAEGRYSYDIQQVAWALAKFKDARACRAVVKLVAESDERTSRSAAQPMARCRSPQIVPDIVAYLKKAGEPKPKDNSPQQAYAMQALSHIGDESAAGAVLNGLASPNDRLRRDSGGALRKVVGKKSVPVLTKALETGKAPGGNAIGTGELVAVIREIVKLEDGRTAKTLLALAKHPNEPVATEAASGLAKCVDPKIAGDLIKAWKAAKRGAVKSRLDTALKSGGYPVHWVDKDKTFAPGPAPAKKDEKKKPEVGAPF